ncbi:MAG: chromate transporter [Anaerolineae bacterium]|nr:chromate transporter [Anaerolineae bacterium]MCX8068193.1 chromate transporter [Anaerolineae bacterium]MDW7992508.1 chromate transporter [Anaerolineae bacterium]
MEKWLQIFWLFLKINLLTTSGPASAGLLYKETVGRLMTEEEFIEAVGFSSVLPGSDALQLAMFVGYALGGIPGALVALLGSILPPTVLMLTIVTLLQRIRGEAWVSNFVQGLAPAVAVLMVLVAWKIFGEDARNWKALFLALASFIAFQLKVPPALVLLASGLIGIWLFR